SAHVGEVAVVHYRWHPQSGTEIRIAYREHRGGEDVIVFETPNRSRTVLPAWMLDAGACAEMTHGPPRAAISSMLELRSTLTALGFDRTASPVGEQERSDEGTTASTIPTRAVASPRPSPFRSRAERAAGDPASARRDPARRRRSRRKGGAR